MEKIKRISFLLLDRLGVFFSSFYLKYQATNQLASGYLNERSIEYSFVLENLSKNGTSSVLDVGSGTNSFAATLSHCGYNVTASDLMGSYWRSFQNRHINVLQNDITNSNCESKSFDAVTCISTLEHIPDYQSAVREMSRIVKDGGLLIVTFPYSCDEFCENVYALDTADDVSKAFRYIARSFCDEQIGGWCREFGLEITDKKHIQGWEGKYWRSGARIRFPLEVENKSKANSICIALKKNDSR